MEDTLSSKENVRNSSRKNKGNSKQALVMEIDFNQRFDDLEVVDAPLNDETG